MLTVEKVLRIPKLEGIHVAAGAGGLQRKVGHVTVMEVPDIIQWLKGDDFLITSLFAVKDDVKEQCRLLEELAYSSCACMAVKTGQYVKTLSRELLEQAEALNIPLLIVPYHLTYIDIIMNVMTCIFEDQNPRVILETYIKNIIFDGYTQEDLMIERGNLLGYSVEKNRFLAMTFQFPEQAQPTEQKQSALWKTGISIAQFASSLQGLHHCIAVNTEKSSSILLDAEQEETIQALLPLVEKEAESQLMYGLPKQQICVGYGNYGSGLKGIRDSYFNSIRALKTGQIFYPQRRAYHFSDMELHCVMAEVIGKNNIPLFHNVLSKVDSPEILETLTIYFEANANMDETAARLFVHKNTIKYRLQRIRDLTGLDVKNFNDSFKLYVAVLAHKLQH